MSEPVIVALIGAAGVIMGVLSTLLIQARRLPSEVRLTEAQAEKTQHESAALVIKDLSDEVSRLKVRLFELEERLTKSEARATGAESRLADAETRAYEFRRAVIAIGERLDHERAKSREMVGNLVGIIEHLLDCIEHPGQAQNIDRPAIARLIQSILNGYQPEGFIGV